MNPQLRGWTSKVSMALITVGVVIFESSSICSGVKGSGISISFPQFDILLAVRPGGCRSVRNKLVITTQGAYRLRKKYLLGVLPGKLA
jgi:hypothetical protein